MIGKLYEHFGIWGAVVVSIIVLAGFTAICTLLFFRAVPAESTALANILFGALATMSTNVVAFWTGSSIGSMQKNAFMKESSHESQ